jgi:hypothetical protein
VHDEHIGIRGNEALDGHAHARRPGALEPNDGFLNGQALADPHAHEIGRELHGQLADWLRAGIGPLVVARRCPLAKLLHSLDVLRASRGLHGAAVRAALPAFHLNAVGDLIDVRGPGVVAEVEPPVPHVALAEPPDDAVRGLVHAHRQVAIAEEEPVLRV